MRIGPDGFRFVIDGPPRTKKNSGIITTRGRTRILPSASFAAWNRVAQVQLAVLRSKSRVKLPFICPINCSAWFYRDKEVGDAVNYYQALADILQEARIIENDSQIRSWDGSRLEKDAENPRVKVWLLDA